MKTEVRIKNGFSRIMLYPENDFEYDLIEKAKCGNYKYDTVFYKDDELHGNGTLRIEINLSKKND